MSANSSPADDTGSAAAIGADIAKDIVALAGKVADEVMAGFQSAAERTNKLAATVAKPYTAAASSGSAGSAADASQQQSPPASTTPKQTQSQQTTLVDSRVVSQLFDLAQQALKLAGDTAGRVLQTGLGPIEKVFDRDSHRHDDAWVTLPKVAPGQTSKGSFQLVNSGTYTQGVAVTLTLVNPLASMKGTIPAGQVSFDPNPAQLVPANDGVPSETTVQVTVQVPDGTPPATYLGIVRSAQVHDLTIVLRVDVG